MGDYTHIASHLSTLSHGRSTVYSNYEWSNGDTNATEQTVMQAPALRLSFDQCLVYVLRESKCLGRATNGHIERISEREISLHDEHGARLDYFSGAALRSWCVVDSGGKPLDGWHSVLLEDKKSLLAFASRA